VAACVRAPVGQTVRRVRRPRIRRAPRP